MQEQRSGVPRRRTISKKIGHKKIRDWKSLGRGQVQSSVRGGLPKGESALQLLKTLP
ncbi:MAG: hypothetical protein Q7U66_11755 [Methylobacter sp.]|nr:hypothetical protein [Methylobacter sp.]